MNALVTAVWEFHLAAISESDALARAARAVAVLGVEVDSGSARQSQTRDKAGATTFDVTLRGTSVVEAVSLTEALAAFVGPRSPDITNFRVVAVSEEE